ncbi:hypothetical protein V1525DRAFT_362183 [Lipomyces kononenkoae]|uniref:Uncharacterized protein n=1 Tax=Lipomyces kononenkoae TaxID=34357 RepID=A0ACC3SZH1_LIPKO
MSLQMQQQSPSPYRQPQARSDTAGTTATTTPFTYTSKFRIIECSAGRNWTDADILTLIEAYKECKRDEIAAREATAATVYAAAAAKNARTSSANGPNPVDSTAALRTAASEKPETIEAFFEKVHAVFVKSAMNPQRTAKSLHEKFGFLTLTYRRIKDFQTGKLFGTPAGANWWDIPIKEQRRYLTKSMTPMSDIVYEALEPLIERSDFQKRAHSVLQSRVQPGPAPVPATMTTFTTPDGPLMNAFSVPVMATLTQESPVPSQQQSSTTITRTQSSPLATSLSTVASVASNGSAQTPETATVSTTAGQDTESQHHVYVLPQYRNRSSGAGTSPHTQVNANFTPGGVQSSFTKQHTYHSQFQVPIQFQVGNNMSANPGQQAPTEFYLASTPSSSNSPNSQQPKNRDHLVVSMIQRQATRGADAISSDLEPSTALARKRRRVEQDSSTMVAENEGDYEESDTNEILEPQHGTNDYPPPLDAPPRVSGNDRRPQQQQSRWSPSAEEILQEFVTLYKHSLEEQRQRDEQLLLALERISQMTSAICKAVEQVRTHSNATDS